MVLCPLCGGLFSRQSPRGAFGDSELYHPEDLFLQGCICHYDLISLERIMTHYEERLNKVLSERFPGKKRQEIPIELGKMDRHSPLRVSLVKKMQAFERAQKRLKELRKGEEQKEQLEEGQKDSVERAIIGDAMSLHDWIVSTTK